MDEIVPLLHEMLDKLSEISSTLIDISSKLQNVDGVYGIDDVVLKLEEAADDIRGPTGYNLTDIFAELSDINIKT